MVNLGIVPGVHAPRTCGVIEYSIEGSGQTLILTHVVIDHLNHHRQSSLRTQSPPQDRRRPILTASGRCSASPVISWRAL